MKLDWYDVFVVGALAGLARGLWLIWLPLPWLAFGGVVLFLSIALRLRAEREKRKRP